MSAATTSVTIRVAGSRGTPLVAALLFIALVVAAIGSLGAPLITAVAQGRTTGCPWRPHSGR